MGKHLIVRAPRGTRRARASLVAGLALVGSGISTGNALASEPYFDDDSASSSANCNVTGGSAEVNGDISGDASLAGNLLAQAPVGGANALNLVCNNILNDNVSGNTVNVNVLAPEAEAPVDEDDETPTVPPGGPIIDGSEPSPNIGGGAVVIPPRNPGTTVPPGGPIVDGSQPGGNSGGGISVGGPGGPDAILTPGNA